MNEEIVAVVRPRERAFCRHYDHGWRVRSLNGSNNQEILFQDQEGRAAEGPQSSSRLVCSLFYSLKSELGAHSASANRSRLEMFCVSIGANKYASLMKMLANGKEEHVIGIQKFDVSFSVLCFRVSREIERKNMVKLEVSFSLSQTPTH